MEVRTKQRCVIEFLHAERNCSRWHSSTLAERLPRPNSVCENSEAVVGAFQQWQQWCETQATFRAALHSCQLSWISWDPDKPSALTAAARRWLSWRPEFAESGQRRGQLFLLQHDNARHSTSLKTMDHVAKFGWTVLPHPPYSPDWAPADFHRFGPTEDGQHWQHFPDSNTLIAAVRKWAASAGASLYERSMQALV
jgi:hypothetical protein